MKRIGAVIVGLLCLSVAAVHAEDGTKELSMDSFKTSITTAKEIAARETRNMAATPAPGNGPSAGKPSQPVEFIVLDGGRFKMGADNGDKAATPIHEVGVKSFEISATPVTVEQYAECVIKGRCGKPGAGDQCNWEKEGRQRHPINCVNWEDANDFAKFKGARLPSEAEWEYAATSGGQDQKYPWGNDTPACDKVVMAGCGGNGTMPVCSKSAGNTKQGLCDMAGNVWQWAADAWHDSYAGAPVDGRAWEGAGALRVLRGGTFSSAEARQLRADNRDPLDTSVRYDRVGFRIARSRR